MKAKDQLKEAEKYLEQGFETTAQILALISIARSLAIVAERMQSTTGTYYTPAALADLIEPARGSGGYFYAIDLAGKTALETLESE